MIKDIRIYIYTQLAPKTGSSIFSFSFYVWHNRTVFSSLFCTVQPVFEFQRKVKNWKIQFLEKIELSLCTLSGPPRMVPEQAKINRLIENDVSLHLNSTCMGTHDIGFRSPGQKTNRTVVHKSIKSKSLGPRR